MKYIDLSNYAPSVNREEIGAAIYNQIMSCSPLEEEVEINMTSIKAMATFCAKQIFGTLYKKLGSTVFFKNIKIIGASENVKLSIQLGIEDALKN